MSLRQPEASGGWQNRFAEGTEAFAHGMALPGGRTALQVLRHLQSRSDRRRRYCRRRKSRTRIPAMACSDPGDAGPGQANPPRVDRCRSLSLVLTETSFDPPRHGANAPHQPLWAAQWLHRVGFDCDAAIGAQRAAVPKPRRRAAR
jgi:hypothetical protein